MTQEDFNQYKVFLIEKLESLDKNISKLADNIETKFDAVDGRIDKLDVDMAVQKTKSGIFGGLAGLISSTLALVTSYLAGR